MSLNESIVEEAALEWSCLRASTHRQIGEQSRVAPTLTRPLPRGEEMHEIIRRLSFSIPEEARATIKRYLQVQIERRLNP